MQRLLSATPGWYITGINGTTEPVSGNLQLIGDQSLYRTKGYLHHDLICHEALIWVKDAGELRSLRQLTGCIVSGGEADTQHLCVLNVKYEPRPDVLLRRDGRAGMGQHQGTEWRDACRSRCEV